MDGSHQAHGAAMMAPEWDSRRREVFVLRQDPLTNLKGRLDVRFQVEFAGDADLQGESAVALIGESILEAGSLIARLDADVTEPVPPDHASRQTEPSTLHSQNLTSCVLGHKRA